MALRCVTYDKCLLVSLCCSGDTLGSIIYVPCEVMKQRMQVQGSKKYWTSVLVKEGSQAKLGMPTYGYYPGMFQAGRSIWKEQGLRGLYAGYLLSYS